MITLTTSGVGSYLFIRGFAFFLGGLPSEGDLISDLAKEEDIELDMKFWIYFSCWLSMWLLTGCYQANSKKTSSVLLRKKEQFQKV